MAFGDEIHFSHAGAERVGQILYESLCRFMADRFADEGAEACIC